MRGMRGRIRRRRSALIAGSIREFGFNNPVLVDKDESGIIAGHGRVLAARQLGLTEVPVIELAHLSAAQKRAYILADNRLAEQAGWDRELLALELGDLGDLGIDLGDLGLRRGGSWTSCWAMMPPIRRKKRHAEPSRPMPVSRSGRSLASWETTGCSAAMPPMRDGGGAAAGRGDARISWSPIRPMA